MTNETHASKNGKKSETDDGPWMYCPGRRNCRTRYSNR